jgi:hypothetical protein
MLPGGDPEEAGRVRAHAAACEACAELLQAYDGDERMIAAARVDRRAPVVLEGFTAQVMARIAEEERRPAPVVAPAGVVIVGPWTWARAGVAAAAAVLLIFALRAATGSGSDGQGPRLTAERPDAPVVTPQVVVDDGDGPLLPAPSGEVAPLPAPRLVGGEHDPAPMPLRLRRRGADVVPVDGNGGGRGTGGVPGLEQDDLLDLMQKYLPQFRGLRGPGAEDGAAAREVKF